MKDKLIIAGVIIALVFTFLGYSMSKQLSGKVSALEKNVDKALETQKELAKSVEELNEKVLVSERTMSFIENLTKSLTKIIKEAEDKEKKIK